MRLLPLLLATAAAGPVLAQAAPPAPQPLTRAAAQGQIAARFRAADADGNGIVTRAEYDAGLAKAIAARPAGVPAPTPEQLAQIKARAAEGFTQGDANKDGRLTLAELSARPMAMFDRADTNKDGTLSPQEQAAAMQAMGGTGGRR